MKENSREEDIEELKRLLYRDELTQYGKRKLINYYEQQEKDYKRVLKENEELLEVKVSASAHNRILELEKENEELKNFKKQVTEIESTNFIKYKNFISKQKVKDNLIKYQEEYELLLEHQSGKESNRTKYLRGRIHMCQELLESEE